MDSLTFTITGGVNVQVTVTETGDGTLTFDLSVLDETGQIGDLNAIFFDLSNDAITGTLTVEGDVVSGTAFKADGVTKVDSYTNMNGEVVGELGKFDVGVQFGSQGIGTDDIREASFVLSSSDGPLSLTDIALQDFGVRLTSVGEEGGSRDGSLKLGGAAPEEPVDGGDGGGDGGGGDAVGNVANDDVVHVYMADVLAFGDEFELVNGTNPMTDWSVLSNDTTGDAPYTGLVEGLADDEFNFVRTMVDPNGGSLDLYVDGAVDFHPGDAFNHLRGGETETRVFEYAVEGGDTATITVMIHGTDDLIVG